MTNNIYRKFASLYATNLWGVMNDNLLKLLVCYVAVSWVEPQYKSLLVNAAMGILVFPYLFLSPIAGKLPGTYSKVGVLRVCKAAELPIMCVAIVGFVFQNVWLALLAILLMGMQSALYSPSKYGLIKDLGGVQNISKGMGGMEAIAFFGMLSGSVLASYLASEASPVVWYICLSVLATLGFLCSLSVRSRKSSEPVEGSTGIFTFIRDTSRLISKYRGLHNVIHFLSLFWWLSASLQAMMVLHCDEVLGLSSWQTGILLSLMAIGISVGCVVGGRIDSRINKIGISPLLGLFLSGLLFATFAFSQHLYVFSVLTFLVALCGGMMKIPLDAEIQKRVSASELSVVLAYFNEISFIYIFLASATNVAILYFFPTRVVFLVVGIVFFLASLVFIFSYRKAVCQVGLFFMRTHYDITEHNRSVIENATGNMLILPAHRALIDPLMLFGLLHDTEARPLSDEGYFKIPIIGRVLRIFGAIEVPDLRKSRRGVEKVMGLQGIISNALASGADILFYPSGHITTDGSENIGTRQLAYEVCLSLPESTRVISIRIDGLWGSRWSRYGLRSTPSIVKLLLRSALLIFSCAIYFIPRRKVSISYEDITDQARQWATTLTRRDFNHKLEEHYSQNWQGGIEAVS